MPANATDALNHALHLLRLDENIDESFREALPGRDVQEPTYSVDPEEEDEFKKGWLKAVEGERK